MPDSPERSPQVKIKIEYHLPVVDRPTTHQLLDISRTRITKVSGNGDSELIHQGSGFSEIEFKKQARVPVFLPTASRSKRSQKTP